MVNPAQEKSPASLMYDVETLGLEYEDIYERKDNIKQEYEWKSEDKEYRKDHNPDSNSLWRRRMT